MISSATANPIYSAPSTAGELLVSCARAHLHEDELEHVRQLLERAEYDWDKLLRLADENGVTPLLNKAIESACPDAVPEAYRQQLRQHMHQSAARQMLLMRQLLRLLTPMNAQQIRAIPYKGPVLALFAYGDLSLRQPGDLDILIPESDLSRAHAVLQAAGFRSREESDPSLTRISSPHEYHHCYVRDDLQIAVEVHWQVVGRLFSFAPDPVDLWNRGEMRSIAGSAVRVLSPEDMILVLCAHGMKHFWSRLLWICDVAQYIAATPSIDWPKLMKRAEVLKGKGIVLLGLVLAHRVLGAAVPQSILSQARPSICAQAAELEQRLFLDSHQTGDVPRGMNMLLVNGGLLQSLLFHFRTRESWSSGLRYCFHRMFTPNVVDEGWLHLPRSLSLLYYVLRPVRLFSKYGPLRFLHSGHRQPQQPATDKTDSTADCAPNQHEASGTGSV